jgi:predicted RNA-binding Zn-ribbon protein involved in translation (DUF1610 family)
MTDRYQWLGRILLVLIAAFFAVMSFAIPFVRADVPDFKVRSVKTITNPIVKSVSPAIAKPKPAATSPHSAELHSHLCPKCGHEWWHGDEHFGSAPSHSCPKCGTMQWTVNRHGPVAAAKPVAKPMAMPVFKSQSSCPGGNCPIQRQGYFR